MFANVEVEVALSKQTSSSFPCSFFFNFCPHGGSSSPFIKRKSSLSSSSSHSSYFGNKNPFLWTLTLNHDTFFKIIVTLLNTASSHIYSTVIEMFIYTGQENTTNAFPAANLITGISDYFIWCCKQIPDIVTDLLCHGSPWLHFPPKQVKSFYLFAPWIILFL